MNVTDEEFRKGESGFTVAHTALVQRHGRVHETKEVFLLTFRAIEDAVLAARLATRDEATRIADDLSAFLVTAQRLHRIYLRCAAGWHVAGTGSDAHEPK